jgi:hypothetical protein
MLAAVETQLAVTGAEPPVPVLPAVPVEDPAVPVVVVPAVPVVLVPPVPVVAVPPVPVEVPALVTVVPAVPSEPPVPVDEPPCVLLLPPPAGSDSSLAAQPKEASKQMAIGSANRRMAGPPVDPWRFAHWLRKILRITYRFYLPKGCFAAPETL